LHPIVLFFVLLFIPGTSLTDWQNADAPNLHRLLHEGAIGLMNCRTAERDTISAGAGERTILAGARLYSSSSEPVTGYSTRPDNLDAALVSAGTNVTIYDQLPAQPSSQTTSVHQKQFVAATLSGNWAIADHQVGYWMEQVALRHGRLMIVAPNPTPDEYSQMQQLTPIVYWGNGIPSGFLTSDSTRTDGLVVNTDLAPTVAFDLGATLPVPAYGTELTVLPSGDTPIADLVHRDQRWVWQARSLSLLPFTAGFIALLVFLSIVLATRGSDFSTKIASFCISIPLVLLLSPSIACLLSLLLLALVVSLLNPLPLRSVNFVVLVTTIVVVIDGAFLSGRLTGAAMLGYSPIEGARYYGIGNETMGLFVGSIVVLTTWMGQVAHGRRLIATIWIIAGLVLALPETGAKAGGLIVCGVALAVTLTTDAGYKLNDWVTILSGVGGVAAALILLIAFSHIGPRTHVSETVNMAQRAGSQTIEQTIARKAGMDLHLVFHSVWIWVLASSAAGRWLLYKKRVTPASKQLTNCGTAATLACLLFNDAGVIAAALCSLIIWGEQLCQAPVLHVHTFRR
jgi:hypothetical protein